MLSTYIYNYLTCMNDIASDIASDIVSDIKLMEQLQERLKTYGMTCELRNAILSFLKNDYIIESKKTRKVRSKPRLKNANATRKRRKHVHYKTRKNNKNNKKKDGNYHHNSKEKKTRKIKCINTL
jgi:hypothetical protein